MTTLESRIDTQSAAYRANHEHVSRLVDTVAQLRERTIRKSAQAKESFRKKGKLLPRERLARLLDPGQPFFELMSLAGYQGVEDTNPETSVPGAAIVAGIGSISGVQCMVVVSDAGISAGAMQGLTAQKVGRCQDIALTNKLPFIQLVESAGGNLRTYQVERFINGGIMYYQLARLSAAGIPVVSIVHGNSTAGGAYLPGMSDYVVMVRNQARAFLAGPSLLRAATGEEATEEELGGAEMHAAISGLADYVAESDADAVARCRDIVRQIGWNAPATNGTYKPPRYAAEEMRGVMPVDYRSPVDMREVLARLVDDSDFHEFKQDYGPQTLCGYADICGIGIGVIANNGPLDPRGSTKAAEFIQLCEQLKRPILFLQNITGFVVGRAFEEVGMVKHGAKLIQALSNASVPRITIMCGASFGAGNFGMCGRAFKANFLFSWPNAITAVMGGEQAAMTMRTVAEAAAKRTGRELDIAALEAESKQIVDNFNAQSSAIYTSSKLLDDGVIDPRDTREVLGIVLRTCQSAKARTLSPIQFGVARF